MVNMRDWNSMNIQGNVQLRLIDTKLLFSMLGKADHLENLVMEPTIDRLLSVY